MAKILSKDEANKIRSDPSNKVKYNFKNSDQVLNELIRKFNNELIFAEKDKIYVSIMYDVSEFMTFNNSLREFNELLHSVQYRASEYEIIFQKFQFVYVKIFIVSTEYKSLKNTMCTIC